MSLVYPYNEILPKRAAHDVFIFDACASLAKRNHDVTLICGKASLPNDQLFAHYGYLSPTFHIERLPIVRKNNPLNISWNFPFFYFTQQRLLALKPTWVFLSVRKQGAYHLERKIPGVKYLYEIHELAYYPGQMTPSFKIEHKMLQKADLITTTTEALKEILLKAPYSLTTPIEVVPLAVKCTPLPPPSHAPFTLMYIGQLYAGQGLTTILNALAHTQGVHLTIVGGKDSEIEALKKHAHALHIHDRVTFAGFIPPHQLPARAQQAHAFVAPFEAAGRMPYVAHTKLFEYAHWGRPIIAPKLPVVIEHFEKGMLLYEPGNTRALAACIEQLKDPDIRKKLQTEIETYAERFSWERRIKRYEDLL